MNINGIYEALENGIDKLNNPKDYKGIVKRDNNLVRFDFINRILLYAQNNNAFDVRTEDEWKIADRQIINGEKPIFIVIPKYESIYIDKDTNKQISDTDLSMDETYMALKYGIIERSDTIKDIKIQEVYDIRQTKSLGNNKYRVSKPIIGSKNLVKAVQKVLMCNVENSDITYFSNSDNTLRIENKPYEELAKDIVDIIVDKVANDRLSEIIEYTSSISFEELSEYDIDLIKLTTKYALDTLLHINRSTDLDIVRHTQKYKILSILNIADSIVYELSSNLEYKNDNISKDITKSLITMHKANIVLNIMEANDINKKINGA